MNAGDFPPNPREKPGYVLAFDESFDDGQLNPERWVPYYLPHWSSRQRAAPRYQFDQSALILQIEADQEPWCPEFDGDVRCSSIQTGLYAGPVGSTAGQHRFKDVCVVREAQPTQRTYTPQYGYFEARVKAVQSPASLVTLWMIGFEETSQESGEIAIFEIFGDQITSKTSEVRYGIHPWGDATLTDEFYHDVVPIDATHYHIYAADWTPTHVDFYIDNVKRRTIKQSPAYPMQFMLGIYELPGKNGPETGYPRQFTIDYIRGYQPA